MRITGGELRGRHVRVPKTEVRPTQDRVREALFNMLGDRTPGCRFLDLFAGSGAVGIEAWSRGAATVCWVESHPRSLAALRQNVTELCPLAGPVLGVDVRVCLKKGLAPGPHDIIFCDPPYEKGGPERGRRRSAEPWLPTLLRVVREAGILATDGLLIMEQAADEAGAMAGGWAQIDDRVYGGTRLRFYRLASPTASEEGG